MIAALWSLTALAADEARCTKVGVKDLVPEAAGPAIVVLGERPGVEADGDRMESLVKALSKRGKVTLAAQALPPARAQEVGPFARVVAIEAPLGARKPAETPLAMPPLYIHPLAEAMGEGKMPPELEPRFVEQVAWIDHQLASAALEGWDGAGFLVILVDRLHVQGGLGVAWQATQMSDVPVHQALLADAGTLCVDADRILKSPLF